MIKPIYFLFTLFFVTTCVNTNMPEVKKTNPTLPGCGLVYGKNHSFFVCAPENWVLDNKSGVKQGLHAVFYPIGSNWSTAPAVMYVKWATKDQEIKNIKSLVEFTIRRYKSTGSPDIAAKFIREIKTEKDRKFSIWGYSGDKWGNNEYVGYIEEKFGFVILVLTSGDYGVFVKSQESFFSLVSSYSFMTDQVELK